MNGRRPLGFIVFVAAVVTILMLATPAHAGFADGFKKKIADKAAQKATQKADKPVDKSADEAEKTATAKQPEAVVAADPQSGGDSGGDGGKLASVSTKFDFVPGDSVIFVDDFKTDELGEFPTHWRLAEGTFEVAEMAGERWLRCTSVDGRVLMKLPPMSSLPEFWTLEFDFYGTEPMPSALTVRALGKGGSAVWSATYPQGKDLAFRSGEILSTTTLETPSIGGRHHVMFMARGPAIKVYIDRQRMASVPEYSIGDGKPADLDIRLWAPSQPMITNVRFAKGCRPAKDMLAEGKLVTYGIRFDTGSDVVLPESAPILRQIAAYLGTTPAVRLKITGHTDNVGAAASNLELSKRRAAAVAKALSGQFGVSANRFETDGKGDTQAISSNAKPEGRAMNRRVEFAKL